MPKRDSMVWRGHGLSFAYEGGPYIEIYAPGASDAFEVINVWDYAKGESTIQGRTHGSRHARFVAACREWLKETWAVEGVNYLRNVPDFWPGGVMPE